MELSEGTTDAVLDDLQSLASLQQLDLTLSPQTNRSPGLKHLAAFPGLKELDLQMPLYDDTEIADLPSLPRLTKLRVFFNCGDSGDKAIHYFSTFPNVRQVTIGNLGQISEIGMADLVARFPGVESLHLGGGGSDDDGISNVQAVDALAPLPNLTDVTLGFTGSVTDRNVLAPFARLPQLANLHVNFGPAAVDLDMSQLAHCRKLTQLTVSADKAISDSGLADIAKLTSLHEVDDLAARAPPSPMPASSISPRFRISKS